MEYHNNNNVEFIFHLFVIFKGSSHTQGKMEVTTSSKDIRSYIEDGYFQGLNDSEIYSEAVVILPSVFCVIGIITNTLVIIVIVKGSLMHIVFMSILMLLAITDNVALCAANLLFTDLFGSIFGESVLSCHILSFLVPCSGFFSSWLIVLISVERFTAVFFPLKVHIYFTLNRTYMVMVGLAVVSCMISAIYPFAVDIDNNDGYPYCYLEGASVNIDLAVLILSVLLYSIIPFSIISIFNIFIVTKLQSKSVFRIQPQNFRKISSRDKSLVIMMYVICIVFVVTTFPLTVSLITISLLEHVYNLEWNSVNEWFHILALILANINHGMNFFFYCITGSVFRKALFNLFRCNTTRNINNSNQRIMAIS